MIVDDFSTSLASGDDFTSNINDVHDHVGVVLAVHSDQSCKVTIEWSLDGVNFDHSYSYNVMAGTPSNRHFTNLQRWMRWKVENTSATDMTHLRLSHKLVNTPSTQPMERYVKLLENDDLGSGNSTAVVDLAGSSGLVTVVGHQNEAEATASTGNLIIEHSYDGTSWYHTNDQLTLSDGDRFSFEIQEQMRYIRFTANDGDMYDMVLTVAFKC